MKKGDRKLVLSLKVLNDLILHFSFIIVSAHLVTGALAAAAPAEELAVASRALTVALRQSRHVLCGKGRGAPPALREKLGQLWVVLSRVDKATHLLQKGLDAVLCIS